MPSIRSPLGALGALMVLLEGIAAGALIPLGGEPELQSRLVWMMIGTVSLVTVGVMALIGYIAVKSPGLLFNPSDIDPSAHVPLYAPNTVPRGTPSLPPDRVEFSVSDEPEP